MPDNRVSSTTAIKIVEAVGSTITRLIAGAMLFGPGLYFFLNEINDSQPGEALHKWHLTGAVTLMVGGALCVNPPFGKQISSLVVTIFPNGIPLIGGRRASDPQPTQPSDEVKL